MSIKKLLLSALLLTTTGFTYAQETTTDYIQIEDCTGDKAIVAGVVDYASDSEEGFVSINLEIENRWCALQFDLYLPEGVELRTYENKYWDYDEEDWVTEEVQDWKANTTDRFKPYTKDNQPQYWTTKCAQQADGAYRFIAFNMDNKRITNTNTGGGAFDNSQKWIFKVRLIAKDDASTGTYPAYIKNAIVSNSVDNTGGTATVTGSNCPIKDSNFTIQINAKVGADGYGTFSWPRDVDLSNDTNVEDVYVAKDAPANGWLHLTSIGKQIPAGTGVIIKGSAGLVHPETINYEEDDDPMDPISGNKLLGTYGDKGGITVGKNDDFYALAKKSGKTAFYPVSDGFVIPQYKAYMTSADGAKMIVFDDTATSIDALDLAEEEGDIYTLGGQKVQKTTMKGVYIKNGKKVVVK